MNEIKYITIILLLTGCMEAYPQQATAIDSANLMELIRFSEETFTDEFVLVYQNEVIYNWKNNQCDSLYFNTASMVKTWTGLVIGILIDEGLVSSEEDPVCNYLPEWEDGCKHQVTIKHLLTMSAGINSRRGAMGILAVDDMHQYALDVKLDTLPNIRFNYSNESVQLLGLIIEKVSGRSANDYFREVLFEPLRMDSTRLGKDPNGKDVVFGGARTTVNDAVKIGMLMAGGGSFNGRQIVQESWIKKSVTPSDKASFYGYLTWLDYNSVHKNYAATGDFGQMTIVFPDLELVFVRKQSCNKDISGNMTWMGPGYLKLIASILRISD